MVFRRPADSISASHSAPRTRLFTKVFPHLDYLSAQFFGELSVGFLAVFLGRGRINGIAEADVEPGKTREAAAARPSVVEAFQGHGIDGNLEMRGKNSGAFLELLGRSVNRALAFGIQHQVLAPLQAEGAGAHGVNQVGIGIDRDQAEGPAQEVEQASAEDLAGADVKHVLEQAPGNLAGDDRPIEKALVVGRENERSLHGQLLFSAYPELEKDPHEEPNSLSEEKPAEGQHG